MGVIILIALAVLGGSLTALELQPRRSYTISPEEQETNLVAGPAAPEWLLDLIVWTGLVTVVISMTFVLISKEARKRVRKYLRQLVYILPFILLLSLFYQGAEEVQPEETPEPSSGELVSENVLPEFGEGEVSPLPEPESPPSVIVYLVSVVLIAVVGGVTYYFWWEANRPRDDFGMIAQAALRDLSDGRQWEDTVIQCYANMTTLVNKRRQVVRNRGITPREFVRQLQLAGLPAQPVERLTVLFERARYSSYNSDPVAVQEATQCLTEIANAVRRKSV